MGLLVIENLAGWLAARDPSWHFFVAAQISRRRGPSHHRMSSSSPSSLQPPAQGPQSRRSPDITGSQPRESSPLSTILLPFDTPATWAAQPRHMSSPSAHTAPGTQPGTPVTLQPQPTLQSHEQQAQLTSQPQSSSHEQQPQLTPAPSPGTLASHVATQSCRSPSHHMSSSPSFQPPLTSQPSHVAAHASRHAHHFEQQPAPFRSPISRRGPSHVTTAHSRRSPVT